MQVFLAGAVLLPLLGFIINQDKVNRMKENRGNKRITDDLLGTQGKVQYGISKNINVIENKPESKPESKPEDEKIIFNDIGEVLNDTYSLEKGKEFKESTIFKNIGGSTDKTFITASLRKTDENGLSENFGSYKDNFPYDPVQSKNIDTESHLKDLNLVNKFKKQSNLSSIILPKGVNDYLEVYDVNQKIKKMSEEVFSSNKNKIILSPPEALVQKHRYSISLTDSMPLNLSDSKLEETLEIKIKSKPNINLYSTELNNAIVNDNKSSLFYSAEQKSLESKNIFNLEKQSSSLLNTFNLKN
jgi:hypothetical protein